MDIVLSVGTRDCFIVKKSIQYIKTNLASDTVFLITDIRNKKFFPDKFIRQYNIVLIDENSFVPGLSFSTVSSLIKKRCEWKNYGWYLQQFLKIGFATSEYAKEQYLIWDADTFPLRPLLFYENAKYFVTPKTEYHKPYFKTIHKLLNLDKIADYSFIAEHMMIDVNVMKEMINTLMKSDVQGDTWWEKIINALDTDDKSEKSMFAFSEFETYGTYFLANYRDRLITKTLKTYREAGTIYGRGVTNKQLQSLSEEYDTVSFEVRHVPPFPKNITHWSGIIFLWLIQQLRRKYPSIGF